MNKLIILLIAFFFINNCSFNENSKLWQDKEKELASKPNIKKVFSKEKKIVSEFNQDLKLDISFDKTNNKVFNNKNNFGFQNFDGGLNKNSKFKFSKFKDLNQIDFNPIILKEGVIFFDNKGSIIKYDKNQKIVWKRNYYTKLEKKLQPRLDFTLNKDNLIVTDNISKYYSFNLNSGKLNWSNNNSYPFNSEIKKYKNKFFVIDYKNTLRCYNIIDGSECWSVQTEDTFTVSSSKYSLIIFDKMVVFNNSTGDITAVDIETGLITWLLPTQGDNIISEAFNFKFSKLVLDNNSIFFSNNKNEFYSIDVKTGTINWIAEINSNITPIIAGDIIFTVSDEGFLYIVEKNQGNIIKITDLYKNYKEKERNKVYPIGFAIGNKNLYLTNSNGRIIVVDLSSGEILKEQKVSGNLISKPLIFNNSLYLIRNGSIDKYN
ncbi:PQQ-binding-like beta-propeller repeat protein [Candidatus Pelagibacter sp.]|nr:PQQ-binding-like beta-propeller repeat protein [Candidatus Pelagibacter sp.]